MATAGSGFEVAPDALLRQAEGLDVLADASARAVGYARYTHPEAAGGAILVRFLNGTQPVEAAVSRFFTYLQAIADTSGENLKASARYYRQTDEDDAARFDSFLARPNGG